MHVLVIGGTRFVGPLFVFRLLAGGHRVTLFNRATRSDPFGDRVERLVGDRTTADLSRHMSNRRFDAVVDFAAYKYEDARGAVEALGGRVGHYVFISTGQVYLVRQECPRPAQESDYEGSLKDRPTAEYELGNWEYGMGKRECEDALVDAWRKSGFPSTRIRIPVVAGERDHYQRLDPYVFRLLDGGPVIIPDGGVHLLRQVYASEVARFLVELVGRENTERVLNRLLRVARRRSDLLSVRCTLPSSSLAVQRSRRLFNTLCRSRFSCPSRDVSSMRHVDELQKIWAAVNELAFATR
jgi:nucleoside-diphosphate-sugar epimerase